MVDAPVAYLVAGGRDVGFPGSSSAGARGSLSPGSSSPRPRSPSSRGSSSVALLAVAIPGPRSSELRAPGAPRRLAPPRPGVHPPAGGSGSAVTACPTANSNDYHLSDVLDPGYLSDRTFRLTAGARAIRRELEGLVSATLGGRVGPVPQAWILVRPVGRASSCSRGAGFAWPPSQRPLGRSPRSAAWRSSTGWRAPPIHFYISVTVDRVVPTVVLAGGAIVTRLLLGRLVTTGGRHPCGACRSPATRPSPGEVAWSPSSPLSAALSWSAARRRPTVHGRAATPNASATLARQLVTQFRQEQALRGLLLPLTATCDGTTPDGLSYTCVISTTRPVGSPADRPHLEREHRLRASPRATGRAASPTRGEALD